MWPKEAGTVVSLANDSCRVWKIREVPTDGLSCVKGATDGSCRSVAPEVTAGGGEMRLVPDPGGPCRLMGVLGQLRKPR